MTNELIIIIWLIGVLFASHGISFLQREDNCTNPCYFIFWSLSSWFFVLLFIIMEIIPRMLKRK